MAHGEGCPLAACLCLGATGQRDENLCHSRLPLPPDFGSLASSSIVSEGARGPCQVEVLPLLVPLSCRAAPGILPGKRREATGPVPEPVLPMQA